ncbi:O-antigen ligase family protein [Brachybacterium huguangmaarense]|uniref:O-antigen ligase family protein n=1 Tax=Brachybacterium huguangmaarense TaxID=1652028 RepID=A0ABY6G244_9MICO|nr:O-antigen ligase family protein [Brachybacterium huguangmaarense]UYG17268.1 O-antigen ligase family protein [Brachybacterium huguangmaarense]
MTADSTVHQSAAAYATTPYNDSNPLRNVVGVISAGLALAFNQASVIAGANISVADIILLPLLLTLALRHALIAPRGAVVYILTTTALSLGIAAFVTPDKYDFIPPLAPVLRDTMKQLALGMYLIVGYSLAVTGLTTYLFRIFASGAVAVTLVGITAMAVPSSTLHTRLFYLGIRFRGLFDDPNYLGLTLVSAIAIFTRNSDLGVMRRALCCSVLSVGVIMSGSKTASIVLVAYLALRLFAWVRGNRSGSQSSASPRLPLVLVLGAILIASLLAVRNTLSMLFQGSYAVQRVWTTFSNFPGALSEQGSGRQQAWSTAVEIISENPITGIGLGSYGQVAQQLEGSGTIAHNTYLQVSAESGLIVAVVTFALLFWIILRSLRSSTAVAVTSRDIALVMLAGSFSVSLNNVRLFWLAIGILLFVAASHAKSRIVRETIH